jgi:hypothetical protein
MSLQSSSRKSGGSPAVNRPITLSGVIPIAKNTLGHRPPVGTNLFAVIPWRFSFDVPTFDVAPIPARHLLCFGLVD